MKKSNIKLLFFCAAVASFGVLADDSYVVRVPYKLSLGEWKFEPLIYSDWNDVSGSYDCSEWIPDASSIEEGLEFEQTQTCKHDMERLATLYKVNSITGEKVMESEKLEFDTKEIPSNRTEIGTMAIRSMCVDILNRGDSVGDGIYTVDPDGSGGIAARNAYCDMSGGGWTLYDNFGSKLVKTGDVSPPAFNASGLGTKSSLSSAGYSYYLTSINDSRYHRSSFYMQFYYSYSAKGYIKKNMPDWVKGVRVSASNEWSNGDSYTYLGSNTKVLPTGTGHRNLDFDGSGELKLQETSIYWVDSVWIK